ncbi:MAG: DUF4382 domain-containing protein [Candidatus Sulfotelmatobacter sp.]
MKKFLGLSLLVALTLIGMGCGSNSSSTGGSNPQSASVFMTGEDAPLSSVVGFNLTLNTVTLNGQDGSTATVISTPTTVDFARLLGLRAPLAFNTVKPDTYVSATFVLANPVVDYVTLNPSPAVTPLTGVFPSSQNPYMITVSFPTQMVVGANGLAGLRMDMDIRDSVATDGNGNLVINNNTIAVNPVIFVKATKASDPDGQVTDLMGGLVAAANTSNDSFVIQGPYGRQLTVYVNNNTLFNSGWSINNLVPPAVVGVQGRFQADGSLMADAVEVITTAHSFVSGRILALNGSGAAETVTMWVGETGADMASDVDTIQTFNIGNVTTYEVCFFDNALTQFVFSDSTDLMIGQRIFIGGDYTNSTFTPATISLRRQGVYGTFNTGSVTVTNGNAGSFLLSNNGLVGYSAGGPVPVDTFNGTVFFDLTGLNQLQTTSTDIPLVVRGLFLKDPTSGNPTFYAGFVADPPQPASK